MPIWNWIKSLLSWPIKFCVLPSGSHHWPQIFAYFFFSIFLLVSSGFKLSILYCQMSDSPTQQPLVVLFATPFFLVRICYWIKFSLFWPIIECAINSITPTIVFVYFFLCNVLLVLSSYWIQIIDLMNTNWVVYLLCYHNWPWFLSLLFYHCANLQLDQILAFMTNKV